jgi:hypothetical protein
VTKKRTYFYLVCVSCTLERYIMWRHLTFTFEVFCEQSWTNVRNGIAA